MGDWNKTCNYKHKASYIEPSLTVAYSYSICFLSSKHNKRNAEQMNSVAAVLLVLYLLFHVVSRFAFERKVTAAVLCGL